MVHRTSTYPLGKLLLEILRNAKMTIQPFVLAIGYRNPSKGIRAFDGMLGGGYPNEVFLERLRSSELAPDEHALQEAIDHTLQILDEEERVAHRALIEAERAAFRPFFEAVPEKESPSQICFFALSGGHSRYTHYLPDAFLSWSLAEQYRYLAVRIPEVFVAAGGRTLFMGAIIAYRLFRQYDGPALFLSVNGKPLWQEHAIPLPDATIEIGGKRLCSEEAERLIHSGPVGR